MMVTPIVFVGWVRVPPRGRWREVCRGSTQAECWRQCLIVEVVGSQVDRIVLPDGEHPNKRKR